jgi:PAS domain S-box-containing protein
LKIPKFQFDLEAELFKNIFDGSPIGMYIVQDGKFRFVNPQFQEITGYREDELLGMKSLSIVHHEDRDRVRQSAIRMLKEGISAPYICRFLTKDGDLGWVIETVTSVHYGGRRATLGYFMDITEFERAKEALRLSEEKFSKAFRLSPEWFVITTLEDGFYIDVNDAFLRTTGYRRDEVLGRASNELGIWANPLDRTKMVKMLKQNGEVRNLELQFRMKSGEIRQVLWSAELIDYMGEKCLIALTRDITHRKRMEEERLKREKVQAVLEMAGAACHELNQPLQHVFYLLNEILQDSPPNECTLEMKKQLSRIKEIIRSLENMTTYETKDYVRGSKIVDIDKASIKK